jgi:transcriptional regulator with XRE-family HTH domain
MEFIVFAKRVKDLRENQKLTTRMMAGKIGVTSAAISYYENGKREPKLSTLLAYSKYFGVTLDYLIGISDDPYKKG